MLLSSAEAKVSSRLRGPVADRVEGGGKSLRSNLLANLSARATLSGLEGGLNLGEGDLGGGAVADNLVERATLLGLRGNTSPLRPRPSFVGVLPFAFGLGGVVPFPFLPPRRPLEGMVSINSTIT